MVASGANPNPPMRPSRRRDPDEDFQPRARQLTPSAVGRTPCPKKGSSRSSSDSSSANRFPSHLAHHERLSRVTGLAVLSSDALSSVAYATEEILRVLVLVGAGALALASPIAFVIAAILAIVVVLLPADDPRVSERRRRVHRRQGQSRRNARADRGRLAADRLHPHGRGEHCGGRGGADVGVSAVARQPGRADARVSSSC